MPNETPFGPLESLVGRTFEAGGVKRIVLCADQNIAVTAKGSKGGIHETWFGEDIALWLSGAKEVTP